MKRFWVILFVLVLVFSLAGIGLPSPVLAAAFTVNSTGDGTDWNPGDGVAETAPGNGICTLRAAIQEANALAGPDTITFNIPGAGPHTIQPASALPTITDPVVIDGYTQPGASPNTNGPGLGINALLMIELDGSMAGAGANGLHITGGNSAVRGLVINRFSSSPGVWASGIGILLDTNGGNVINGNFIGTDVTGTADLGNDFMGVAINGVTYNTIGGTTAESRNIISGNGEAGIIIYATGNLVQGNFIGTDVTGTAKLGNGWGVAILFDASNNIIGGTTPGARNVISGNDGDGVVLVGEGIKKDNLVQGNFIGTDVTGTTGLGNIAGVVLNGADNNTIGGTTAGAGNLISGNDGRGVTIAEGNENLVQGNFIGTDVTGTADLGNSGDGVHMWSASSNIIGGTTVGARNIISGNGRDGVVISHPNAIGNLVQGNFIGTDVTSTVALGNSINGVWIIGGRDNTIGGTTAGVGNTIAFNGGDGVVVEVGTGNAILSNSIFYNASLGIDLDTDGVTPNDPSDGDTGANNLQNFPALTSATSGSTTIEGTLNSTPNTKFRLEFFSNTECDPSGYGEGETFLGFINVTTDGSGNVAFTVTFPDTVPGGHFITATATDPNNNTSEFSECVEVAAAPSEVWVDDDYTPGGYNDGHTWGYDAFAKIQDGIDAVTGSVVHVAAGTYYENITLVDGVQVLGAGADVTTIDGEGSGSVVTADSVGSDTVLDGFTITGGNAPGGGGMLNSYSSPTVINCIFCDNSAGWGGGMYNGHSSPTVTDCTFYSNSAINGGGGMYNHDNSPATVANCIFSSNSASWGGGMQNHVSSPTVINCIFCNNSVAAWGGGMNNAEESSPTVTNCTFSSNSASIGGSGISGGESSTTVTNCILWDNGEEIAGVTLTTVTYCDVQGGYPGDHNISEDPMFVDPAGDDYHLKAGSPCIDKGTDVGAPTEDIEGNPRPIDGDIDGTATTDMGAYEYFPTIPPPPFKISIRAYIDGRSLLITRANTVQWHHLDWASPGRHGFVNLPTIINGIDWYPQWPDVPDEENRWCDCFSSIYEDLDPALAEAEVEIELRVIQARHSISIAEHPSTDNDYALVIDFDNDPVGGPTWYECELNITVPQPLAADFRAEPTAGVVPLTVNFTDKSIGDITKWSWDFGDSGTSNKQSPSHTYTSARVYTVSLTVSGPSGIDTETKVDYIAVYKQPSPTVGGAVAQVDKFGLMMPWIIVTALVLLAITSLALWMKKNKKE